MFGGDEKPAYDLADIYVDMREQVLTLTPEKIGDLKKKKVWAVLMETGYPESAATLVAVADGSASLYFSNGGGIIGAGEHENVRPASLKMTKDAEGFLEEMDRVESFPTTSPGMTVFYIVTNEGVFTYKAKEEELGEDRRMRKGSEGCERGQT